MTDTQLQITFSACIVLSNENNNPRQQKLLQTWLIIEGIVEPTLQSNFLIIQSFISFV